MITGRETLQVINEHILQARSQMEAAVRRVEALNQRLTTLRFERGEQYRKLAKFRLDEIRAGRLAAGIEQTGSAVMDLLNKREKALEELQQQVQASLQRQQLLEEQREAQEQQTEAAAQDLERRLAAVKSRVEQLESYQQQKRRTAQTLETAKSADAKASQVEADRARKGEPYEADALFMYLWQRRYMTPDYHANAIMRSLDNWVARLIDYPEARTNYHMLTELPVRLRAHAGRIQAQAELEAQALERMEKEAAEADGIPALQSQVDEAEGKLEKIDDEIVAEEARHQQLLSRQSSFTDWSDQNSRQALTLLASEMERQEMADLYRRAQATPSADDDLIVSRLNQLVDEQKQVEEELQSVRASHKEHQRALVELEGLRQKFRRQSYDRHHSGFQGDFAIGMLLGQLFRGSMSSDGVWDEIQRAQRGRRPPRFGGYGRRGFGRGGFGGGGFGTGGGFGGGGFRTGSGF
ncbi:MAG: hypothetical protein JSW39_09330 [Desulfobacterales bacterium]|nr:MAG: hypothetical protein JSW39_09330 [Desulfobacterales bacterium]